MSRIDGESETFIPTVESHEHDMYLSDGVRLSVPGAGIGGSAGKRTLPDTQRCRESRPGVSGRDTCRRAEAADLVGVAHSLRADGFDASEDGTGRGTPLVPVTAGTLNANHGGGGFGSDPSETFVPIPILEPGSRTGTSTTDPRAGMGVGEPGDPMYTLQGGRTHAVAFSCKDHGADAGDAPTLRAMPHDGSHANAGRQVAVAFTERTRADGRTFECQEELAYALTNPGSGGRTHSRQIAAGMAVRRLTPRECERLQGFPDNHTLIPYRGKPAADGPRYKSLGNSMAVPVMRWIGRRILSAEGQHE